MTAWHMSSKQYWTISRFLNFFSLCAWLHLMELSQILFKSICSVNKDPILHESIIFPPAQFAWSPGHWPLTGSQHVSRNVRMEAALNKHWLHGFFVCIGSNIEVKITQQRWGQDTILKIWATHSISGQPLSPSYRGRLFQDKFKIKILTSIYPNTQRC